jgi:DNA-nicking Smr family endonuclease
MKKKEKPKQKEKEFAVSPFQALKGAALAVREPVAPPAPPKKAPESAPELDDEALFFEAVMDVRRIRPTATPPPAQVRAQAAKAQRDDEEQRIFLQAVEALKMDVRFSDAPQDEDTPQRQAPVNRLRQVRRGGIRIDLQLDLHGLTRDEAIESLDRFVRGAYNRGQKGVLVITGKGNNSAAEPVLKAAVSGWLRDIGKTMVSEFAQAPQEMGGSGALVVFLKEKKVEPAPTS